MIEREECQHTKSNENQKRARAGSDDDVLLGVHLAMKMLVDHSEPARERARG